MQDSRGLTGSDPQRCYSVQIDTSSDRVERNPFSDPRINSQIWVEVARIRAAWLEGNAEVELTETSFEDRFVEMLVATLDAHAKGYLSDVDRQARVPEYIAKLQRLGEGLYNEAKLNTKFAKDTSSHDELLSPELRRQIINRSAANLLSGSMGGLLHSSFQTRKAKERSAHKVAAVTKLAEAQLAKDVEGWLQTRDEILFRVEIRFAGRYQFWRAEALEGLRDKEKIVCWSGRDAVGVSDWGDVEIEFISDERVQIRVSDKTETLNYGDMGFMDRRDETPNESWIILRKLGQQGGILADSAAARKKWPAVEKHMQRIRKVLREQFALEGDPIPFVRGVGFRTRFKIRCAASFET
jgi:hypothetical protein